jgi:hypothetical protein
MGALEDFVIRFRERQRENAAEDRRARSSLSKRTVTADAARPISDRQAVRTPSDRVLLR